MTSTAPLHTADRPLAAALFMICAMLFIGVIDNYIQPLSRHIGLWQFHLLRTAMALPLVALLSLIGQGTLWPRRFWAVGVRSALVAVSMLFYFSALAMMPIAQALAGLFTSPIFILLFTAGALGQRIGIWRISAVGLGFLGILLVLQPDPSAFDATILIPICAGFFYALGAITTRTLCAGESPVALLGGLMVMLGIIGLSGVLVLAQWPTAGEPGFVTRGWSWDMGPALLLVAVQAAGSVAGVFLIIRAYQLAEPSYVAVFEYSVMIFGPLYAWLVFGVPIGPWQGLGVACIAAAGVIIALRSR